MSVSIDRVYQKVLTFANKEQRGYITPQEFNLFANQAQMEIFEQYFYDINQWGRQPGNTHEYSDPLSNLEDKISLFERIDDLDLLNKRAIFVYLRDISNLNPKQLSIAMSSIRKHYKLLVKQDEFDIFF